MPSNQHRLLSLVRIAAFFGPQLTAIQDCPGWSEYQGLSDNVPEKNWAYTIEVYSGFEGYDLNK